MVLSQRSGRENSGSTENKTNSPVYETHPHIDNDKMFSASAGDTQACMLARNVAEDSYWRRYTRKIV